MKIYKYFDVFFYLPAIYKSYYSKTEYSITVGFLWWFIEFNFKNK